jgi:ubiquinone/menaquinone biosynthesis C-methylase UbiE
MNERVFNKDHRLLRDKARLAMLEVDRVVALSLEGIGATSALDIGTGTAIFAEAFANAGLSVGGIDLNPAMIEEAKRLLPSGDFRLGGAEAIPFEAKTFDLVFLGHVLHEVDDPAKTLTEAARVGKKRIAVLEWPYVNQEKGPPLPHRLSPEAVASAAKSAGIALVKTVALQSLVLYLMDLGV